VGSGVIGAFLSVLFSATYAKEKSSMPPTAEIVIPDAGLAFITEDRKTVAKLVRIKDGNIERTSFLLFNQAGTGEVELNAFSDGGNLSVYDNQSHAGAAASIFTTSTGGHLTLMGGTKSAIQMGGGENGGRMIINESEGLPVVIFQVNSHRGEIVVQENGGPAPKPLWKAP
jgi:hypothetical protein